MMAPPVGFAPSPGAHGHPGVLFVLEGIDRSGRSTHARGLEARFRYAGLGVTRTSLATSLLSGDPIRAAKHEGATESGGPCGWRQFHPKTSVGGTGDRRP